MLHGENLLGYTALVLICCGLYYNLFLRINFLSAFSITIYEVY